MGGILPKGSYPNSQSTPQAVSYLEGELVLTHIHIHEITEEWQTTVATFLLYSDDFLRMQIQIHCYIWL